MRLVSALFALAITLSSASAQPQLLLYGTSGGAERGADVAATADSGFVAVGSLYDGSEAIYVVRADADGAVVWERWLTVLQYANRGFSVEALPDGGALVIGAGPIPNANGDWRPLVFRLDAAGEVLWRSDETFAPTLSVDAGEARGFVRPDGQIVLGSGSNTYSNPETPWLAFVAPDGQTATLRRYPSLATGFGVATYVYAVEPFVGGTVTAGEISGYNEAFVWTFSAEGDSLWSRRYRPEGVRAFYSVREAADGSLLAAGCTLPNCTEAVAARLEADGTPRWVRVIPGDDGWYSAGRDLIEMPDGQLVLTRSEVEAVGSTTYRTAFDMLSPDGEVLSTDPPVPTPPPSLLLHRLTLRADGSLLGAGTARDGGTDDLAIVATPRPVALAAAPGSAPIVIPAAGGAFTYTVTVTNHTAEARTVQLWTRVTRPGGQQTGALRRPATRLLAPGATVSHTFMQSVPGGAAPGLYTYTVYVGTYRDEVLASDAFPFTKAGGSLARPEGVDVRDEAWSASLSENASGERPAVSGLEAARPNPFAQGTTVAFALEEASDVRLVVYDVLGREVAVLVDSEVEAGRHEVLLDGSRLPGGTYLVRLEAEGLVQTQRLTLAR